MKNDFTIACLLTEPSVNKLSADFKFLDQINHPHISLFQFRCDIEDDFLKEIKKLSSSLTLPKYFHTQGLSLVEKNIFLNIADDGSLQKFSDELAEFYFKLCKNKEPLSQIDKNDLTDEQLLLVNKYGIYWIKQHFNPHVTLVYETAEDYYLKSSFPEKIEITFPGIFVIDRSGRVIEI